MITLAATETLRGKAGTASAITYTLFGDVIETTDAFKTIAQGQLGTGVSTLFTVPDPGQALIKTITLANTTASNVTGIVLYAGGTAATNQLINLTIPANGSATYGADGWSVYDSAGVRQYVGSVGPSSTASVGTTTTLVPASSATVANSGTPSAVILDFGIPAGAVWRSGSGAPSNGTGLNGDYYLRTGGTAGAGLGDVYLRSAGTYSVSGNILGPTGLAATIAAGTTTTAAPGSSAAVANSGTSGAAIFDFTIPAGSVWRNGTGAPSNGTGLNGDYYLRTAGGVGSGTGDVYLRAAGTYSVVGNILGPSGTASVGTTTTGAPGTSASVSNTGTPSAGIFNFTIPAGAVWRNGTGVPSNGTGLDGDYYLRTGGTAGAGLGDVYLRATGTYSVVGNILGPTGSTGAPGVVQTVANADTTLVASGTAADPRLARAAFTGPITVAAGSNATVVAAQTGTGSTFVMQASPAITTPTIASFVNSAHDHSNAAGGGNIPQASVTNLVSDLAAKVPAARTLAGLDLTADRSASTIKSALSLTSTDVGLGNVTNTSDANKPVSTAQQTALDLKFNKLAGTLTGSSNPTPAVGLLAYNTAIDALEWVGADTTIVQQMGREHLVRVKNTTGSTIVNGSVVYYNGADAVNDVPTIALAKADQTATSQVAGISTQDITNGSFGYITAMGGVHGLNTAAYAPGTPIYLSATTAGGITATQPVNTALRVRLGASIVQHASLGSILVQLGAPGANAWYDIVAHGGADPTGVTDCTSIINAATTALSAVGGGIIYFPAGSYKVNTGGTVIAASGNFITYRGAGNVASQIITQHATSDVFQYTGINNRWEDLRIIAASDTLKTAGYAINANPSDTVYPPILNAASGMFVYNCSLIYMWSGLKLGGQLPRIDQVAIRECGRNAINGAGVLINNFIDAYISNLEMDHGAGTLGQYPTGFAGIRITNLSSLIMTNIQNIHATVGIDVVPVTTKTIPSIYCMNAFFDQCGVGANFAGAGTISRNRFIQCWFSSNTGAGVVLNNSTINGVEFVACEMYGNATHGIQAISYADWAVRSSKIAGNTTTGIITTAVTAGNFSITDNYIGNGSGFGNNGLGINIQAGTYNRYQILDNRGLELNTTPGITDSGSAAVTGQKNVANNMGVLAGNLQPLSSTGAANITGRGAVTSGVAETFLATFRVPANGVQIGDIIHLTAVLQSSSTGTLAARIRLGTAGTIAGDTLVSTVGTSAAGVANSFVVLNAYVYVVALGPTATAAVAIQGTSAAAAFSNATAAEAVGNVPTTAAWFITFSGLASVGTYTVRTLKARII